MQIKEYCSFDEEETLHLYTSVGWTNYSDHPDMIEQAYKNSLLILGAFEDNKLIAVIRAVGDGASVVFIQDILVLPEYQRQGIGTQLLRTVMEQFSSVYQMVLMTDNTPKTTLTENHSNGKGKNPSRGLGIRSAKNCHE